VGVRAIRTPRSGGADGALVTLLVGQATPRVLLRVRSPTTGVIARGLAQRRGAAGGVRAASGSQCAPSKPLRRTRGVACLDRSGALAGWVRPPRLDDRHPARPGLTISPADRGPSARRPHSHWRGRPSRRARLRSSDAVLREGNHHHVRLESQ
jgi:hypothetical protein